MGKSLQNVKQKLTQNKCSLRYLKATKDMSLAIAIKIYMLFTGFKSFFMHIKQKLLFRNKIIKSTKISGAIDYVSSPTNKNLEAQSILLLKKKFNLI